MPDVPSIPPLAVPPVEHHIEQPKPPAPPPPEPPRPSVITQPDWLRKPTGEDIAKYYPDRAQHVMALINQTRGGKDYDAAFGQRMRGTGAYAELLRSRFELAKRKLRLSDAHDRHDLNCNLFQPPARDETQLTLGF